MAGLLLTTCFVVLSLDEDAVLCILNSTQQRFLAPGNIGISRSEEGVVADTAVNMARFVR